MYSVGIITSSDKGYEGLREDKSGSMIREISKKNGFQIKCETILPDDRYMLANEMKRMSDEEKVNLILTTGGTGFSKRDVTPEATRDVIEREVPGISEAIRAYSLTITKRAMLSRAISGIRGNTLIINLPGSPKAVAESLEYIIDTIKHGLDVLSGGSQECGR